MALLERQLRSRVHRNHASRQRGVSTFAYTGLPLYLVLPGGSARQAGSKAAWWAGQLFDLVVDYPESRPALQDAAACLRHAGLHGEFTARFRAAIQQRLLHAGAPRQRQRLSPPPGLTMLAFARQAEHATSVNALRA